MSASAQTDYSRGRASTTERSHYQWGGERIAAPGDRLTQSVFQKRRNGAWIDTTRRSYPRYDAAGHVLERITEDRVATGWRVRNRFTIAYNSSGQRANDTLFSYLGNPLFSTRRTYNAAGQVDSVISRTRFLGQWEDARRDINYYDGSGNLTRTLQQDRVGAWFNFGQILYTTDAQGHMVAEESQRYDDNTGTFNPESLLEYTYTASDSIASGTYSEWSTTTGAYEILGRDRFTYSAAGQLDSIYNEPYAAGTYGLSGVATYQYDARGNRIEELLQQGASLSALTTTGRTVYTYTITGLEEDLLGLAGLTLAPNPAVAEYAELSYQLTASTSVLVEVVDMLGRQVANPLASTLQSGGAHRVSLNLQGLRAGLYLVRLTSGASSHQVKLVVQ